MVSEIRYVLRTLLRRKGFALVTVLTLALGIGSATAIYAVVDWVLFQGPPSPKDLFLIGASGNGQAFQPFVWDFQYRAFSELKYAFADTAISSFMPGNVVVNGRPVDNGASAISPNFFKVLAITPAFGRGFITGENFDGHDREVVVSDNFWRQHLGGSPDALGMKVVFDQKTYTVVGVLREGERLPLYSQSEVYKPLVLHPDPKNPWNTTFIVIARTRPGVSRQQAEAALDRAKVEVPPEMRPYLATMRPVLASMAETRSIFNPQNSWVLLGAVAFLYGIACLNATNLVLVHMLGKQREVSVRLALGAGRWALLRLLLIETLGFCLVGCLLGAVVANWLIPIFTLAAHNDAGNAGWNLGFRTYCVLGGLTLVTGILIALVPGVHLLRSNIHEGLKNGGGAIGESRGMARVRSTFVVLQAAFAVILLVGAGLMVHTFERLEKVQLGFDPSHRVKFRLSFPVDYPNEPKERMVRLKRLQEALQRVPGVSSVAFGSDSLMAGYENVGLEVLAANGEHIKVSGVYISSDYEVTGGLVLKGGRWLAPDPKGDVLINETLAKLRFGSENPVGQFIKAPSAEKGDYKGWNVVGVVGDVRENLRKEAGSTVYMPISWSPGITSSYFVNLSREPTAEVMASLRQAIYACDPRIVSFSATPISELRMVQLHSEHMALAVLRVLSAIAVLLTIVGMFSLLAYTVDRRMGEFGIRMALGARPAHLVALVLQRGIALTVTGIVIGLGGAFALTRYLQSLLFETPPFDPGVMASVAALLIVSAFAACALPALRASRPEITKLLKGD